MRERVNDMKEIYLAGGCFWGLEMYMRHVPHIADVEVGYANGPTGKTTYEDVCAASGHAEVCRVVYDNDNIGLDGVLRYFFDVIDPTSLNKQGGDVGVQYRTGVYFTDKSDEAVVAASLLDLQKLYEKPINVEYLPLINYCRAEEYHQKYLIKNPGGYCHIPSYKWENMGEAM
ncbi:MAG: peptide-methionine (S)-S-oxide reductase MsrA [Defluviitaleaceae bacterium]|nr:peptide-methionine (S)-S-oxide reductase MsrA [Defluviitaleaceae bacterium]